MRLVLAIGYDKYGYLRETKSVREGIENMNDSLANIYDALANRFAWGKIV